jgi:hypothetical protein
MEATETIVRLKIISDTLTPDKISSQTGLQCDRSWRIGDLRHRTAIRERNSGWILGSGLPKADCIDDHLDAIWSILGPVKDKIRQLSETETVELSVVIYSSSSPELYFESSRINRLAQLGASLDIDLYVI